MSGRAAALQNSSLFPEMPLNGWMALGLLLGSVLLFVVLLAFGMVLHQLRRNRELLHTERLKALEVGQSPLFAASPRSPDRFGPAFWMGAGVPLVAVCAAAWATRQGNLQSLGVVLVLWISVTVISVASIICATVLLVKGRSVAATADNASFHQAAGVDAG